MCESLIPGEGSLGFKDVLRIRLKLSAQTESLMLSGVPHLLEGAELHYDSMTFGGGRPRSRVAQSVQGTVASDAGVTRLWLSGMADLKIPGLLI